MPKLKVINKEVVAIDEPFSSLTRADLRELVKMAMKNERRRSRLLTHSGPEDEHQEMMIVHTVDTYVRPHKHLDKVRTFTVYEGVVDMVVFDDKGAVTHTARLSDYESGGPFYYRLGVPAYYSLLIRSDVAIFKESSTGPFIRSQTVFAPWSPDESDSTKVAEFRRTLEKKLPPFAKK